MRGTKERKQRNFYKIVLTFSLKVCYNSNIVRRRFMKQREEV